MKTLKEYNAIRTSSCIDFNKPKKNGIECDTCGQELWDTNPNITLTSLPAQKNVHCEGCGFKGYRLA